MSISDVSVPLSESSESARLARAATGPSSRLRPPALSGAGQHAALPSSIDRGSRDRGRCGSGWSGQSGLIIRLRRLRPSTFGPGLCRPPRRPAQRAERQQGPILLRHNPGRTMTRTSRRLRVSDPGRSGRARRRGAADGSPPSFTSQAKYGLGDSEERFRECQPPGRNLLMGRKPEAPFDHMAPVHLQATLLASWQPGRKLDVLFVWNHSQYSSLVKPEPIRAGRQRIRQLLG